MRIELFLDLKVNKLPIEYRRSFISFYKIALEKYENGRFYDDFYSGTERKRFVFGVILKEPIFNKAYVQVSELGIKVVISTDDQKTGLLLFNALMGMQNEEFELAFGNNMILKKIEVKNEVVLVENSIIFKILSPICIREHIKEGNKDYYYSIKSDLFIEKLKENIIREAVECKKITIKDIQIVPLKCKKTVIKHYKQYIETTIGEIGIYARPDILNWLYRNGIGSRKSAGFGLLAIARGREV